MQLGSLIKKTNEASGSIPQRSARGIWPRLCRKLLLGERYSSSERERRKTHYPSVLDFSLPFMPSLSHLMSNYVGCLVFYLLTLLNNYSTFGRLISLSTTMRRNVTNLCCLRGMMITTYDCKRMNKSLLYVREVSSVLVGSIRLLKAQ